MRYQVNQQVEVAVERVLPFGVFVRLPDGAPGYIRRRELDLDADVEPSEVVQEGQRIRAVIIQSGEPEGRIELSRRAALKDPWPEFAEHHRAGDVIRGAVRALLSTGVFVRVQAGINGFVPLAEIASWQVEKPEDVLWIGDTVEALITELDSHHQRLTLSIKALMLQREAGKVSGIVSSDQFSVHSQASVKESALPVSPAVRDKVGEILVVDDHGDVRSLLTEWLNRRGFLAWEAGSLEEAVSLSEKHNFQVLLADLNLVEKDGLELVRRFRENGNHAHVCIMSSLDALEERAEEIEAAQVFQVFPKPLDLEEMETFFLRLGRGEPIPVWRAAPKTSSAPRAVEVAQSDFISAQTRIQLILEQTTQLIRAEIGLIFQLDSSSKTISILAKAGEMPLRLEALYGLGASPVEDVMREGEPVFETRVSEQARAKFAKLLELLPFESCIGAPIPVNEEIQHAVFFFHREPDAFSHYRLRDAQSAALLFAAILTRQALEKQLQSLNPMLLSGELARGFGHDVSNKITALDLEARDLIAQKSHDEIQASARRLFDLISDLKATVQAFQSLLQTKETQETFDVNEIVESAIALLRPVAQKEHAKIEISLAPNLPPLWGNPVVLQQVFYNLMLNAIQQMSWKAEKFQWGGPRIMRVTTSLNQKEKRIRFRVIDNGPGIHQAHLKRIFLPGFSTRGGSGLGLYIARGFIRSLGGELRVQETCVPMGTTFVVEAPFHQEASQ